MTTGHFLEGARGGLTLEMVPCVCDVQRRAGSLQAWRQRVARIPRGYDWASLANYERLDASCEAASTAVEDVISKAQTWAVLVGGVGCGKTHLAVSAVRMAMSTRTAIYSYVPELLDQLRRQDDEDHMASLEQAALLALDDLGAERPTEWAVERLTMLVDARYRERRATVVTTNHLETLPERIRSRLLDWRIACVVRITAGSYRERRPVVPF